jgi:hypothetical protein
MHAHKMHKVYFRNKKKKRVVYPLVHSHSLGWNNVNEKKIVAFTFFKVEFIQKIVKQVES